jgi:hypothetical protein
MLKMTSRFADSTTGYPTPYPYGGVRTYRSPVNGLDNLWDLWIRSDSVAIINVRGTTASMESWLLDFYSPMVPATGYLKIGTERFDYKLAADTCAAVHTGFLLGLWAVSETVVQKIKECYNLGIKDFIVSGHSQGGAISYLLTSYLYYERGKSVPADITLKNYASAPPKPGNLFYAYDLEYIMRGGWCQRVSSVLDWVPQMPFSVQTKFDFTQNDPFTPVDSVLAENLGFIPRVVVGLVQRSIFNTLDESRDDLINYLGDKIYMVIKTKLPGFKEPKYVNSMDYSLCGSPNILVPNDSYKRKYISPGGIRGIFIHHLPSAYYYLLREEYLK